MKLLIDMNLSPHWVAVFKEAGFDAVHWATVGEPGAADTVLMQWAKEHQRVVFTHDLDFGAILAATQAAGPSVIQLRSADVMPATMGQVLLAAIRRFESDLVEGALVSVEPTEARARILPLRR